jgi:hypothetical protein
MYPKSRNVDKLLYDIKVFHLLIASYNRTMAFQLLMACLAHLVSVNIGSSVPRLVLRI